jgi:3-hydroxymyristoyl/3-hydroxydecanoyl-(acyl carrier protein) dehydratase
MEGLKQLSSIVFDDRAFAPDAVLAQDGDTALTWRHFLHKVEFWRGRIDSLDEHHVAIQLAQADELLSCLWACWRVGRMPVLSANAFRNAGVRLEHRLALEERFNSDDFVCGISVSTDAPEQQDAALMLFTSGSSGAPQKVVKRFFQLEAEAATVERMWGAAVEGTVFASAVSHNHMFGLPFGVLWPLLRGSPFYAGNVQYPELIEGLARKHALTLITSPVQLDNMHPGLDWSLLSMRVKQLFSAGAPLSLQTAEYCQQHFGRAVTEIYGSTETGAVAWRAQPAESSWRCLPDVRVQAIEDGQLRISSPAAGPAPLDVADRGTVHADGRFDLLGRADRIVKLAGKRISLSAVDAALASHPWVYQVRTLQLQNKKGRMGAVVALNADGNRALVDAGRAALSHALRLHIENVIDRVALPRYWRFVSKLPMNTEGKTTQEALAALFTDATRSTLPEILANEVLVPAARHKLTLHVPEELHYFAGHFPGNPVLPGVVQIAWAIHYGKECFNDLGDFSHLEAIKFQHVVLPDARVCLDLQWNAEQKKLMFAFSSNQAQHSSGRVLFKSL